MIAAAKYHEEIEKLVIWGCSSYILPEEVDTYESKPRTILTTRKLTF